MTVFHFHERKCRAWQRRSKKCSNPCVFRQLPVSPQAGSKPRLREIRPDNEEHRSVQHSGDRRARTREFSTRQGRNKGSRRSLSIATQRVRRDRLPPAMAFRMKGQRASSEKSHLPPLSPPRTPKRPGNIDDVITGSRRIVLAPGNTQPDLQIDPRHLLQDHVPARQFCRPFRCKTDPKA